MAERRLGIIVNGATGSLTREQHLPGLLAIRKEGGLRLANGDRLMPDPLLVGRNEDRVRSLAEATGVLRWTTDLDAALSSDQDEIFFDAVVPRPRFENVRRAIAAGKQIYCEKPVTETLGQAMTLYREAEQAGVKHGTVQDKLYLPGFAKLQQICHSGFLGRILEVRLESGFWVFDGRQQPAQRASWNYRKRDGGGLVLDMFPHWRYMLEGLVGSVRSVTCTCRTQIERRWDEAGEPFDVDVEDSVFAQMEIAEGVIASVNSSWSSRIRREATMMLQVDGTGGSAVASGQECYTQAAVNTPRFGRGNSGHVSDPIRDQWLRVPTVAPMTNSYRRGWELFLAHVAEGAPFPHTLLEGAKGVQLAEAGHRSHKERRWIDLPSLA